MTVYKYQEIYYPRNFMPLIIMLAYIQNQKNKNVKRVLLINTHNDKEYKNRINKKIIEFFKDFFSNYFDEIRYIKFKSKLKIIKRPFLSKKSNFLRTIAKSNVVKNNLKKINIENKDLPINKVFCGGDNFEVVLLKKLDNRPSFYFVEHGYGNLRDMIIFKPNFKYKIYNLIIKFLNKLGILYFYPIKYHSYVGILSKNIKEKMYMNFESIENKINVTNVFKIISQMCKIVKEKKKITKRKLKYIFFNVSTLIISKDKKEFQDLLKKISSIINKKNECLLIKTHPTWHSLETKRCLNVMKNYFKKNKIKYYYLENDFLEKLPAELIVALFNIKKVFSDMSSIPFFCSMIYKNIRCYVPLDYGIVNTSMKLHIKKDIENKSFFNNMTKKVRFI
tara:strand:+ start:103 stop:1278 length:1176 start_codon:yes stop_codon:yes gene_type:complete